MKKSKSTKIKSWLKEKSKNVWGVNISILCASLLISILLFTLIASEISVEIPLKTPLAITTGLFVWAIFISWMINRVWFSVDYQQRVIILNKVTGTTRVLQDGDHLLLLWEKEAVEPVSTAGTDLFHIFCKKGDITYQSKDKIPFNAEWNHNVRVVNATKYSKWNKTEITDQIKAHDNQRVNDYVGQKAMDSIQGNAKEVMEDVKKWWDGPDGQVIQKMYGIKLSDFVFSKIEQDARIRTAYAESAQTAVDATAIKDYVTKVREADKNFSGEAGQKGVIARKTDGKAASLHDINIEIEGKDLPAGLTSLAVYPPIQQVQK